MCITSDKHEKNPAERGSIFNYMCRAAGLQYLYVFCHLILDCLLLPFYIAFIVFSLVKAIISGVLIALFPEP